MIDPQQLAQAAKQDIPALTVCGGIFSYCSLANIATVMQQIGVIAAALGAIVLLVHRVWVFWKDAKKK